jgi:DNA polymerase III delta prime subunit
MNNLSYKYKPKTLDEFLGNKESVKELRQWIEDISNKKEGIKNAVLISGITGIGKTTLAKMILKETQYKMHYFNACDVRSSKSLTDNLEKVIYQKKINVKDNKVAILMDELDGMGVGDRGGLGELTKFINPNRGKRSKKNVEKKNKNLIPIICINNNIFDKKINELRKDCLDIFLNRIDKKEVFNYFLNICKKENLCICDNYLMKIIEDSDSDIRRIFFILQDIIDLKEELTDNKLNDILENYQKENYDISIYDSTNIIINEELNEKRIIDLFENDRCLLPQMVHENYINNLLNRESNNNINYAQKISHSLYLCDYIDKYIYTNQNWDLQKIQPYFGALYPNYCLNQCGKLIKKNEPEFSKCLGKTSLQYTNHKNLELLIHELNNKDYNFDDLNLIFKQIMFYLHKGDVFSITKAKEIIQKYGLTLVNLEKLAKINKLDETTESSKIKILFRN